MGLLKNIEWTDDSKNTIVYKVDMRNDYVSKGSRTFSCRGITNSTRIRYLFLPRL